MWRPFLTNPHRPRFGTGDHKGHPTVPLHVVVDGVLQCGSVVVGNSLPHVVEVVSHLWMCGTGCGHTEPGNSGFRISGYAVGSLLQDEADPGLCELEAAPGGGEKVGQRVRVSLLTVEDAALLAELVAIIVSSDTTLWRSRGRPVTMTSSSTSWSPASGAVLVSIPSAFSTPTLPLAIGTATTAAARRGSGVVCIRRSSGFRTCGVSRHQLGSQATPRGARGRCGWVGGEPGAQRQRFEAVSVPSYTDRTDGGVPK